jgi:hypothetical protein
MVEFQRCLTGGVGLLDIRRFRWCICSRGDLCVFRKACPRVRSFTVISFAFQRWFVPPYFPKRNDIELYLCELVI